MQYAGLHLVTRTRTRAFDPSTLLRFRSLALRPMTFMIEYCLEVHLPLAISSSPNGYDKPGRATRPCSSIRVCSELFRAE